MDKEFSINTLKVKIDRLNNEAWLTRVNDSRRSMDMSLESLKLAKSIFYPQGIAEGLRNVGFCNIRLARNEEAIPQLNEALSIFESIHDLAGQAVVYEYLGIIRRNKGDLGGSLELLLKALSLTENTPVDENHATHFYQLGVTYKHLGDFETSLEYFYKSMEICTAIGHSLYEGYSLNLIGSIYLENGDYTKALGYFLKGLSMRQAGGDKWGEAGSLDNIGITYMKLENYHNAVEYCSRSLEISRSSGDMRSQANALRHLAEIYKHQGDTEKSARFCNESLDLYQSGIEKRGEAEIYLILADLDIPQTMSGKGQELEFILHANHIAEEIRAVDLISKTRFALYDHYKRVKNYIDAIRNIEIHLSLEKEFHKKVIDQKVSNLEITHKAEEARKEADISRLKNKELTELNREIEKAYSELKQTQQQLVHAEKMASLGELTAGIAHEIQNPLNFVNNFSEVSKELIIEMRDELAVGNLQLAKEIASDVEQNLDKIHHHGKRADAIVKGMLQHSRTSSGQKEPTDINALCDEYLRLAYHGMKAKDKTFEASFHFEPDENLPKVNVVPQDIGRVLLNLINNAFQACGNADFRMMIADFNPMVTVTTKKLGDNIEILVKDNGPGIPDSIKDKIFQPFFTTKPTGQGTGLGLSLSYDIVKAHGGDMIVDSKEGEGAAFIIRLPLANLG